MLLVMTANDLDLLRQFACEHSQDAFTSLVQRHVNLVYSAALRQVRSPQLAEEVAQSVFADLAHNAEKLAGNPGDPPVLTAWLYSVTHRTAVDVIRKESRRQLREQIAYEMNAMNADAADWNQIEPLLDDAMAALDETDRTALLLRFFENKSLRDVGQQLRVTDDTAQKRVSRAVDRLREFFAQRGVTIGAGGLVVVVSANAVQAVPAGLVATISSTALAGTAVVAATSTAIVTKTIAMTTLQKTLVAATVAILAGAGIYEARQAAQLRDQLQVLQVQQAPLATQVRQLQNERDVATNQLASLSAEMANTKKTPTEVLKLRGEVGALKQESKMAGEKSAISKLTSDPATRSAMREQQKLAMRGLYTDFAKKLKLTPEVTGRLNDMLADNVMDNVDIITQALHDGRSQTEVEQIFSTADKAFQDKIQSLLGDDALTQYKEYTRNLINTVSAAQFADGLTGDDAAKKAKQKQFEQAMQEATAAALKNAGLPADYQAVPMLNFANIASENEASQSLDLLDNIYKTVAANSTSFLSPEELASLDTFRTNALNNSRMMLTMNRKLMAPISK